MTSHSALLDAFHGCGWDTVRLDRRAVTAAEVALLDLHPLRAHVVSCQRLEAYGTSDCGCDADERWQGFEAVQHLAEVAAGLHSVVLGEDQILGQARGGFQAADGANRALGGIALAAARELRARTQFNSHAGALLDKALKLASTEAYGRALILGPGQMGRLVALRAEALGFDEVWLAGRSLPVIEAGHPNMRPALLSDLPGMPRFDCIVGCLGSAAEEIPLDQLPVTPLALDLGTPRNFAGERPGTLLVSLRELVADERSRPHAMARRESLRAELRDIVRRRLDYWLETSESTLGRIRAEAEQARILEVERTLRLHPGMDRRALDAMSRALVNRILQGPSEALRNSPDLAEAADSLFPRA